MKIQRNKVVIVGAGNVGSTILYTLLSSRSIAEIVVIDKNEKKAFGEALDGSHATAYAYSPNIQVKYGDYSECSDANIIIITAGPSAKPGEKADRIALGKTNIKVMGQVMKSIKAYTTEAIVIVVTNPVDILTYYAATMCGYPKEKVFGTGTSIDTARFRRILGQRYFVDTKAVHGYILGEHGGTALAAWSKINVAGIPIDEFTKLMGDQHLDKEAIVSEVKQVGHEVLQSKGFTNFGIAKAVDQIVGSMLANELSIIPLSTTLEGEYGIHDIALSLPCILTKDGVKQRLEVELSDEELEKLHASAEFLKKAAHTLME